MDTRKALSKQTKAELIETAEGLGLQPAGDATNAELIALIEGLSVVTQEEPTAPRPVDPATGRQLDEHGLPLSGPARVAALKGEPDPALAVEDAAPAETETKEA